MRLFIAFDVDDPIIWERVSLIQEMIERNGVKGTKPDRNHLHVTLKFLGEVIDQWVKPIRDSLRDISLKAFNITLGGVSAFPDFRRPRVIIIEIEPNDKLFELHREIEKRMVKLGINPDKRPYTPHLTIYRVKKYWTWSKRLIEELSTVRIDMSFRVDSFKLKESILTPGGPIYKDIETYHLKNGREHE